ncbi:MAG: adenylate/guanylate cyclase domain-containing protein, partial [Chitinophagaceae bacterium]|nr:adenylate/guanylate cyclase domain-containing protein [Chitinophagaceae bacterium]
MSTEHKLAAILFADIAGYTAMMQKNEESALELLSHFEEVLEKTTPHYKGQIVQYFGDGCLLAFESSTNSVDCAIALQKAFSEIPSVPVRIGLHLGDVVFKQGNVFGDGVNIASRIQSLGIPGSILISKAIRDQIKNQSDFLLVSLGSFDFKNVDEPMEVFALANPGFVVPKREQMQGKLKTAPPKGFQKRVAAGIVGVLLLLFAALY